MGTPARQIGWSTEVNLLYQILKQLDILAGVIATSGGTGGGSNFVTTDTTQPITAQKNFSTVAGPAATFTTSTGNGIQSTATNGSAVYAVSTSGPGIEASSFSSMGAFVYSTNNFGLYANSVNSSGLVTDTFNVANTSDLAIFRFNSTPKVRITYTGDTIISGNILPAVTNTTSLGSSSFVYNAVYATQSIISTMFTSTIRSTTVNGISFSPNAGNPWGKFFETSGNFQVGGTIGADTGYKFLVEGQSRFNSKVTYAASTTGNAIMNLIVGVAPTTPNDGDIWLESNTVTGLKIRLGGVTRTITIT